MQGNACYACIPVASRIKKLFFLFVAIESGQQLIVLILAILLIASINPIASHINAPALILLLLN